MLGGILCAKITKVGTATPQPPSTKMSILSTCHHFLLRYSACKAWARITSVGRHGKRKYVNGESLSDAFSQTMIAGNYGPEDYETMKKYGSNQPTIIYFFLLFLPDYSSILFWLGMVVMIPVSWWSLSFMSCVTVVLLQVIGMQKSCRKGRFI